MALFWAFAITVGLHLCLITWFTLSPAPPAIEKKETVINVTFEKRVAKKAAINQLGDSENQVKPVEPTPPQPEKEVKKPIIKPKPKPVEAKPQAIPKVLTTPKSEKMVIETKVPEIKPKPEKIKKVEVEQIEVPKIETPKKESPRPKITLDLSLPQTANLTKNVGFHQEKTIKNVDDFGGAQKNIAEQYRARFAEKITKKFTEMDSEKDVSGLVNFEVEITIDGTISKLEITNPMVNVKLSKPLNAELKKFAEKVIRASAPFEPLPFELGVTALRISRNYNVITQKYDGAEE